MASAAPPLNRTYRTTGRERTLITPEGLELNLVLGSRIVRAAALLLDLVFMTVLIIAITLLLFNAAIGVPVNELMVEGNGDVPRSLQFIVIVWIIAMWMMRNCYFLFFELGARGATWGKRICGLRVASRDGGRLTTEAVIARNIMREIELFVPIIFFASAATGSMGGWMVMAGIGWMALFLFFPFFNRDRLRCGDLIAGTWVVEKPKVRLERSLASQEAARGASAAYGQESAYRFKDEELAIYGEYELQVLESVLRAGQLQSLIEVHEAICRKIGWEPGAGDERAFLEAYYTQLRARLESGMRFGKRKADKFTEAR